MKHEHDEMNKSSALSPSSLVGSMPPESTNLYSFLSGAPIGILTPQISAAALLNLSKLYPHPSFFPWQLPPMSNASPPISPISPALSVKSVKKINNNNNIVSTTTNDELTNNNYKLNITDDFRNDDKLLTTTTSPPQGIINIKRSNNRKTVNFKKKRNQILYQPYTNLETSLVAVNRNISPGPMSPPTSGSSPQSIGSIEHQSPSSSSINATSTKETTRDKSFTCQTCNRSFGYKHVLQNHERTHTGEKPYACPICNRRFTRDHHLKTHMRLHTGEKPFRCVHCDRQFVQVANLQRHLLVHTGEKPYACNKCNSKFSDSNQLKAHALIHKEEKRFRCEVCNGHHLNNQKCTNGPLTPATSPVTLADNKSIASRSDASDTFHDLNQSTETILKQLQFNQSQRTHALQQIYESTLSSVIENVKSIDMPLDLSVGANVENNEKRNRKSNDVRHILRMPKQIISVAQQQNEPEDLSMHSPRSASSLLSEDDFDDLDDAESLNRKRNLIQDKAKTDD